MKKHGLAEATLRPEDWGQRHRHPLWQSWKWTKRSRPGRVRRWNEFWDFAADVGERPTPKSKLRKFQQDAPFGPDNFFWSEPVAPDADRSTMEGRAFYMREWNKRNPLRAKHHNLKKMFGIGIAEYEALLKRQGGKCAICGQVDEWFSLAVDHCHEKKHVRGLLCSQCNRGLGLFKDDPERLRRAADYLESSNCLL